LTKGGSARRPAVCHEIMSHRVRDWLHGTCKSPSEEAVKERLMKLLAG